MSSTPKFSFDTTVTPDLCGKEPVMNPTAAFTLFQNAAGLHAEEIGNGTAALAERNKYWVATHTRIDFHEHAQLMEKITVSTWPVWRKPNAVRGYRGYDIKSGDKLVAEGVTEWVVLDRDTGFVRFSGFGFPEDFEFYNELPFGGKLTHYHDEFSDADEVYTFTVRTSSIDIGRHMNNVAYVRAFLDCFTADEVAQLEQLFEELLFLYRQGLPLTTHDVRYSIFMVKEGRLDSLHRMYADTIIVNNRGRQIKAKTLGQWQYVETIRKSFITLFRPLLLPPGRSICVISPVITILLPKPKRVRNIFICSGVVFCASSRIMKESSSVRPRI